MRERATDGRRGGEGDQYDEGEKVFTKTGWQAEQRGEGESGRRRGCVGGVSQVNRGKCILLPR